MRILFYDPQATIAYNLHTLENQALRGTETTVLKIAKGLSTQHEISICQKVRVTNEADRYINYVTWEQAAQQQFDVIVLVRGITAVTQVAQTFTNARLFLWLHNMPSKSLYQQRRTLKKYQAEIIAVSYFHQHAITRRLRGKWYQRLLQPTYKLPPIHMLYNPIDDGLQPDATPIKKQQLIFTSAIDKGLEQVVQQFTQLRKTYPDYHLYFTNPDNKPLTFAIPEHVHALGALNKGELTQKIRESFCVFYPQTHKRETFGLVYAEANAVGTPVLAHDFGAAREILSDAAQLVNGHDPQQIMQKMAEWQLLRPQVFAKDQLRYQHVIDAWLALLAGNSACI